MIEVGVHQGSVLSPFLFINVMDTLTKMVRKEALWELIFADVALVAKTEEKLQERVLGFDMVRWSWKLALDMSSRSLTLVGKKK